MRRPVWSVRVVWHGQVLQKRVEIEQETVPDAKRMACNATWPLRNAKMSARRVMTTIGGRHAEPKWSLGDT